MATLPEPYAFDVIRLARNGSIAADVDKALSILDAGGAAMFAGDGRRLRQLRDRVSAARPDADLFLGTSETGEARLVIAPSDDGEGALYLERVPARAGRRG